MTDCLDNMDDELTAEYFVCLDQHLEGRRLPLELDEFLDLESRFRSRWRNQSGDGGNFLNTPV